MGKATRQKAGVKVKTTVKAGGRGENHGRNALKLRTAVKAGRSPGENHGRNALKVRTAVKAGGRTENHSRTLLGLVSS
jgi:hypothetical protein